MILPDTATANQERPGPEQKAPTGWPGLPHNGHEFLLQLNVTSSSRLL